MTMDWRTALDRALAASGRNLSDLASESEPGSMVHGWATHEPLECPTPSQYLALSDLTGIEVEVLTGEVDPAATLAVAMRSRGQTVPQAALTRPVDVLKAARAVLRREPHAQRLRRLQSVQSRFAQAPASSRAARQQGQTAALQLRSHLGLGTEAILDLPSVIEDLGIPVEFTTSLQDGMHGLTAWNETREGWQAAIVINANDWWTVQRYTLAHEFCHVLHQDRPEDLTTEYDEDTRIASDPSEARAEVFATHLLAPRAGLAAYWKSTGLAQSDPGVAVAHVMWEWGMSRQAACYALQDCQQIQWTKAQSENVLAMHVTDMVREAGLADEWTSMKEMEGVSMPSTWLSEATAGLFLDGQLPVEHYATVTGQDTATATTELLAAV